MSKVSICFDLLGDFNNLDLSQEIQGKSLQIIHFSRLKRLLIGNVRSGILRVNQMNTILFNTNQSLFI